MNHIYQESKFGENWFTYPKLYSEMVKKFSSGSTFVEVGVWKGKSASYMAVEIANSNKDIKFYCVDNWLGSIEHQNNLELPKLFEIFTSNMSSLRDYYIPIKMDSIESAKKFEDNSLEFVFIDASHEYEDVKNDISAWLPKVKNGGILAGHDYHHPPIKEAIKYHQLKIESRTDEDCWIHYKTNFNNYKIFGL